MKQTAVEEVAERFYPTPNPYIMGIDIGNTIKREAFIQGVKWQQERMYNEKGVNDLLEMLKRSISEINHLKYTYKDKGHCGKYLFDCETIIENFKKK